MNQVRQCTIGNTQDLLTIPKQLSDVNNKVAPSISTFTPNFSLTVAQVYLGLVDKSFQSYASFFILKGKALPGIVG